MLSAIECRDNEYNLYLFDSYLNRPKKLFTLHCLHFHCEILKQIEWNGFETLRVLSMQQYVLTYSRNSSVDK